MEVKREEDNTFKCICGKSFKFPDSLRRHAKKCSSELVELEKGRREVELMNVDDSDVSEHMELDDRVVADDCIGLPIFS